MIELLDDFYHVEQACAILSDKPFDRPLVNALHCLGGESVTVSRWMGLIITMASMFAFVRFLHSEEKRRPFHLFALLHPIILFPFFYASQLSSAVTVAWAIGGTAFFFRKCSGMAWAVAGAFLLAVIGLGVRFEAPYVLIMVVGSMLILFQSRDNLTIVETVRRYFHRENIVKMVVFLGSFFAMKAWAKTYFSRIDGVLRTVTLEQGIHYPLESWFNSQVVAILHYLQNFFFPFSHSFYGNWQEYVWVAQTFGSALPMVVFFSLIMVLLGWSYGSRRLPPNIRLFVRGLVMFTLIALVVSSVTRTEWYYPSRGHLAAVVLMGFASVFVSRLKREKMVGIILSVYLAASMGYAVLFQYKNIGNMYAHDRFFYGDVHPFMRMELAKQEWEKGNREVALQTWFNVYRRIPLEVARESNRAGLFKMLALYRGWWAYETMGRHEESSQLLPQLLDNTYFVSTAVCLQDSRIEIEKCLENRRKIESFCEYYLWSNIPRIDQAHPFRIDIKPHCRKLGYESHP